MGPPFPHVVPPPLEYAAAHVHLLKILTKAVPDDPAADIYAAVAQHWPKSWAVASVVTAGVTVGTLTVTVTTAK